MIDKEQRLSLVIPLARGLPHQFESKGIHTVELFPMGFKPLA